MDINNIIFTKYLNSYNKRDTISFDDLLNESECIARSEYSGSEGCYVEVAKWSNKKNAWTRFAYIKCFDNDVIDGKDYQIADAIAKNLNDKWNNNRVKLIHNLNTFG